MKTTTFVTGLLTLGAGLGCVAFAQQKPAADNLKADRERDTFAIAERLYNQGRTAELDATTRNNVLLRAAELLETFVKDFPQSENRNKALYMRATCLETASRDAQSQAVLKVLAAGLKNGFVSDFEEPVLFMEVDAAEEGNFRMKVSFVIDMDEADIEPDSIEMMMTAEEVKTLAGEVQELADRYPEKKND